MRPHPLSIARVIATLAVAACGDDDTEDAGASSTGDATAASSTTGSPGTTVSSIAAVASSSSTTAASSAATGTGGASATGGGSTADGGGGAGDGGSPAAGGGGRGTATSTGGGGSTGQGGAEDGGGGVGGDGGAGGNSGGGGSTPGPMKFFVTSEGNLSGNFGGISGADQYCQELADAVGAGDLTWRAYVSTSREDARDRIGAGPWHNVEGTLVAPDVAALHEGGIAHEIALDELGELVPSGRLNPGFNEHDVLTGSRQDGTYHDTLGNCVDLTSDSADDTSSVGHSDASLTADGSTSPVDPSDNWNASHGTQGCDQESLNNTGSTARLYCFAAD